MPDTEDACTDDKILPGERRWFQGKEAPRGWREIEYTAEGSIEHVLAEKEPE